MKHVIKVHNLKCGGCESSVRFKLNGIDGVDQVKVDSTMGTVSFDLENESLVDEVKFKLEKMGYPESDPTMVQTAKSYINCMIGRMK